jgi:uncharacterized membrane-anchored protein YjiN (DUF445 family)
MLFGRAPRPPHEFPSDDEVKKIEKLKENFSGSGDRADSQGEFWSKDMKNVSNATESARAMAREVEDGIEYGDHPTEIKQNREMMDKHLDKAQQHLNSAKQQTQKELNERKPRGLFW